MRTRSYPWFMTTPFLIAAFYLTLEVLAAFVYMATYEAQPAGMSTWTEVLVLSAGLGFVLLGIAAVVGAIGQFAEIIVDLLGFPGLILVSAVNALAVAYLVFIFLPVPLVCALAGGLCGTGVYVYLNRGIRRSFSFAGNAPPLRPLEAVAVYAAGFVLCGLAFALHNRLGSGTTAYSLIQQQDEFIRLHLYGLNVCGQMLVWHYILHFWGRYMYGKHWTHKVAFAVICGAGMIVGGDLFNLPQSYYVPYAIFAVVSALVVAFWRGVSRVCGFSDSPMW